MKKLIALMLPVLLAGCAVMDSAGSWNRLDRDARWALLPIANHTDVPQAGLRAEAITEGLLRARGVNNLLRYPPNINPETLFEPGERRAQVEAQKWARDQNARYALMGAVDEWRYKVGVDGEPAVGLLLQVIDLESGNVVWSGVGARTGWSRESLAGVAQKLVRNLLRSARIE
jgi:polysaccharide biosynthesis protein PelC